MERPVIRLRGQRLESFKEYYYTMGYSRENVNEVRRIFDLIRCGNVHVIIMDSLDDICCDTGCGKRTNNCSSQAKARQDISIAGKYGFEIGKEYSNTEVLRMLGLEQEW